MPTLRDKMKGKMFLRGLSESTQKLYLRAVDRLSEYYEKPPEALSKDDLYNYLLDLKKQVAPNSYNIHIHGLKFFYIKILKLTIDKDDLPLSKESHKLPYILSTGEVQRIMKATANIKHRALLATVYGSGLRISEALNLRLQDINTDRMTLHIRNCKNRKDRYVPLPTNTLEILRKYWRACKFTDYIFVGRKKNTPLASYSAFRIFRLAQKKAGLKKSGGMHLLRHAYATHLLEAGTDIFTIKELLGHSSISSTVGYLALTPDRHKNLKSPIDNLNF